MTQKELRAMFPALSSSIYGEGRDVVYLDNAATAQRAKPVIDALQYYEIHRNANIHRAVHRLSSMATDAYMEARRAVADYIGARDADEVIFTSGTTASINLVAYSFGERFVGEGDEVIISEAEHHSNLVPWQQLCRRKNAVLKCLKVEDDGRLRVEDLCGLLSPKTRIVALTQASNVLGVVNPIKEIIGICHERNVPVLIDGAQGIVHCGVDVTDTDCDFYAFSGHKMYGPTGTGVLYGKRKYLETMPPFLYGGDMVGSVSLEETTFAEIPMKFEAGTQNINATSALKETVEFNKLLNDKELNNEYRKVTLFLEDYFTSRSGITLYGTVEPKIPVFSFNVKGVHHEDMATLLDKMRIAVRSGQMCAEPLMNRFGVTGMVRVSVAPYNTMEEAEYLVKCIEKAVAMLR